MIGRRFSPLALALLCGALVAGCGSGSSTTSSSTTASAPTTTTTAAKTTSTPAATTSTTATTTSTAAATTSTSAATSAAVAQYVAVCKSIIERVPGLQASVKAKVEGICSKAADGDVAGARTAAKEVCVEVIDASPVSGATKEKSLAACKGV